VPRSRHTRFPVFQSGSDEGDSALGSVCGSWVVVAEGEPLVAVLVAEVAHGDGLGSGFGVGSCGFGSGGSFGPLLPAGPRFVGLSGIAASSAGPVGWVVDVGGAFSGGFALRVA